MANELTVQKVAIALPTEEQFKHDIEAINRFQRLVRATLIEGLDYGVIPGTDKPTLLKPGAEKMAKLLQLSDAYEIIEKTEDWEKPLFYYQVRCSLKTYGEGYLVSEGLGSCNSMEARYRWRQAKRKCPVCGVEAIIPGKKEWGGGYICFKKQGGCGAKFNDGDTKIESQQVGRVPNDDIYSQVNTILKMAKKRALVDASLSAGRLSDIFTQDMEDISETPMQPPEQKPITVEGEAVSEKPVQNPPDAPESVSSPVTPLTEQNGQASAMPGPVRQASEREATPGTPKANVKPTGPVAAKNKRDPKTILNQTQLKKACFDDFGLQPDEVLKELNLVSWSMMVEAPMAAYIRIAAVRS